MMGSVNQRIRMIRQQNGISQEAFGRRLGIGRAAVSNIETARNQPTPTLLRLISLEFGINLQWLASGSLPGMCAVGDQALDTLSLESLSLLHRELGIGFVIQDGTISGFTVQTPKGREVQISIDGRRRHGKDKNQGRAGVPKLGRGGRRPQRDL